MKKLTLCFVLLALTMVFHPLLVQGEGYPEDGKLPGQSLHSMTASGNNLSFFYHEDSIHRFDFKYPYERKGIKPFLIPTALTVAGSSLAFMTSVREDVRDFAQKNLSYQGRMDDFIQYAPLAAVYALNAAGIKGENNFGNRTAIALKSVLLRQIIVSSLKSWTKVRRPNGDWRSFPSGHTSFAFSMAHFMHREYGERSLWYSFGAYSAATVVGFMRVARNAHWVSDVVAGAGIGMLSTELVYLTHMYKWDRKHLRNWDIFPFQTNQQKGITLVYTF